MALRLRATQKFGSELDRRCAEQQGGGDAPGGNHGNAYGIGYRREQGK
jgi:hypothetical protein